MWAIAFLLAIALFYNSGMIHPYRRLILKQPVPDLGAKALIITNKP